MNLKDVGARVMSEFHRNVLRLTGGRVGNRAFGMQAVELTTTGRKTGKRRTTMLTTPIHDENRVVLVASYGGDDRHPQWFLNLREHPDVEITVNGRTRKMKARIAPPEEKAALWPEVTGVYSGYAQYQKRTSRDIPLVILEPTG